MKKIYTAGKMSGLTREEQLGWRTEFASLLDDVMGISVKVVNPPLFYDPNDPDASSVEAEAKEWDLAQIRDSDVVVINLDGIEDSIGTHYELGYINAINSFGNKHIYVVGFGGKRDFHPWIKLSLFRWEPNVIAAADFVAKFCLY